MAYMLPGDVLQLPEPRPNSLKLGPGLFMVPTPPNPIIAIRAGGLYTSAKSHYWVETDSRRYIPAAQESVIGVITFRSADGYRVNIGSAQEASLDALAFEGATKRNRPNLKVGMLIYARVSLASRDMDPELECFDATTRKADGFGELKDGYLVQCSLGTCRRLLDPSHFLLPLVSQRFPFEVAVGVNGRVWVRAGTAQATVALTKCIEQADDRNSTDDDVRRFVRGLEA